MFSLPFQQTARYVRDYGTEVTEDEKQAIEKVLDYNSLAEIYSEVTADPVKTTYHAQNTKELMDYFTVWFRQFLKHPVCYIESFWNQNYYIFLWILTILYIIKTVMWVKKLRWNQAYLMLFILKYLNGCMALILLWLAIIHL